MSEFTPGRIKNGTLCEAEISFGESGLKTICGYYHNGGLIDSPHARKGTPIYTAMTLNNLRPASLYLIEALEDRYSQTRCGCGHPHCKRCEMDRESEAAIEKARGKK